MHFTDLKKTKKDASDSGTHNGNNNGTAVMASARNIFHLHHPLRIQGPFRGKGKFNFTPAIKTFAFAGRLAVR